MFLYNELIISFIIRLTSAWKVNFSACSFSSLNCAAFNPSSLIRSSAFTAALSSEILFYFSILDTLLKIKTVNTTILNGFRFNYYGFF